MEIKVSERITAGVLQAVALICSWSSASACLAAETDRATVESQQYLPPELTAADLSPWLDGFMAEALPRGDIAGALVVVVKDGAALVEKGFGYADVAARKPMDPERTLVRPGSISKLFVWTAVMQMVEAGKLSLDEDVNAYLDFKIPTRFDRPITLRDLMTHTAGFEEVPAEVYVKSPKDLRPLGQYLSRWMPERIFPPGRIPAYSNYGAALAGYVVERVSGEPFEAYLEQHIFAPLSMAHSTFRQPVPSQWEGDLSKGYSRASAPAGAFELVLAPAGALTTTAADMASFMIAHLQDGQFDSHRLLSPDTARLMHAASRFVIPPLNGMALGFFQADRNGHRAIAHGGDTALFHSYLYLFLDDRVGLFVSFNSAGRVGEALFVRAALVQAFADRYFPAPVPDEPTIATARAHAQIISGYYNTTRRVESSWPALLNPLKLTRVEALPNGTVSYGIGLNGQPKIWHEIAPFVWREVGGRERLAATTEHGRVLLLGRDASSPAVAGQLISEIDLAAWAVPLFVGAACALTLTVLSWPLIALLRRRFGRPLDLPRVPRLAHLLVRTIALAELALLGSWMSALLLMESSGVGPGESTKFEMSVIRVFGLLFIAGTLIAAWNAVLVCGSNRPRAVKLWSVVLALAFALIAWLAWVYRLIGFATAY